MGLFSFHVGCNLGTLLKGTWIYIYIYILIGNKTFIQKIEHHAHDGEHSDQEKIQQVQKLNLIECKNAEMETQSIKTPNTRPLKQSVKEKSF